MNVAAEQEKSTERMSNHRRQIPPEIAVEILAHLPVKSILRFTRVSKSWRSLISEPCFTKKRAAVRDVRRLAMSPNWESLCGSSKLVDYTSCPLSSLFTENAVEDAAAPIICPIRGTPFLHSYCGELWCVEVDETLYLWNPSINIYKKVRNPSISSNWRWRNGSYIYGLGYDSVNDDYKILKLTIGRSYPGSEMYSLKSHSWRTIPAVYCSEKTLVPTCVFVEGSLHWAMSSGPAIAYFELATEKQGNVAPPTEGPTFELVTLTALRGKLCVVGQRRETKSVCVLWVMEEYGVAKSWSIMVDFKQGDLIRTNAYYALVPLHIFDNGEMLLQVFTFFRTYSAMFVYKGEEKTGRGTVWRESCDRFTYNEGKMSMVSGSICSGFVYDEGFFSPATAYASGSGAGA